MGTRKTKDEFIYDSCKKFLETHERPDVVWAFVDGRFRIYVADTKAFPAPSVYFMPRRAEVVVEQYLGDTADLHKRKYEGWSAEDFCAIGKRHYDILLARGQFNYQLTQNILATPADMQLIVTYSTKTMCFIIPDHLRSELMEWQYNLDPLPSNVYHFRHNA